jgi:hypothetical protein
MSKKRRGRLPYCWCCGAPRTSRKRSVCGTCRKLGPAELAYRQLQRDIDRTTNGDGFILRKQRRTFETYLTHPDPRVRAYAVEVRARDEALRKAWREEREAEDEAFERLDDPEGFVWAFCVDPDEPLEDPDDLPADLDDVLGAPAGLFEQDDG